MLRRRVTVPALLGTLLATLGPGSPVSGHAAATDVPGVVRVNQVGYLTSEPKTAFAMTADAAPGATYRVVDEDGAVVTQGDLGADVGAWSPRWPHVQRIDLTGLTTSGRFRVVLGDGLTGQSPWFRVGRADDLYAPLVANGVRFFQAQRDGDDLVPGVMRRRPSHLADRRARVHLPPTYRRGRLAGHLHPTGRTADVSGGWFDAGDYLKFVETTSYADSLLLVAARDSADTGALRAEALYGVRWLDRMWLDRSRQLLYQVGIGDGRPGIVGDHDRWRLPQADDRLRVQRGDPAYYLKHRPALQANRRGERISPNLAGRTAAAFALAAQLTASDSPARARGYLAKARAVLGRARTHGRLLTTAPHSYYQEDEWRDDLELGATEIALAGQALGIDAARQRTDLRAAATWARAYLDSPFHGWFTLARDDQSAVAHADLVRAIDQAPPGSLAVTRSDLTDDLRQQLRVAARRYAAPLGFGGDEDPGADFTFGVAATELLYRRATGDDSQQALGALQRDWALGTNAWGTSLVVGAGTTYPHCPHHQVANLLGPRAGAGPELLGAVANGPVDRAELRGLGAPGDYARPCPAGGTGANPFARFDGQGAGYVDDVRAYSATEPALDYVAVSVLAFTLESVQERLP